MNKTEKYKTVKVHEEIYMGKTIELFRDYLFNSYQNCHSWYYRFTIDGKTILSRGGGVCTDGYYNTEGKAMGAAKKIAKRTMTEADRLEIQIAELESQIAELQKRLAELKGC